ncbi:hypothetical protein LEP1GSC116_4612 [Leptospira interrogans serovar Icterohaemorrhagiae str. Verdun HP]|uniref:Uncharacterized protein n=2 Tax=Leptospira interrogans TaxID=173 RepID=M6RE48_LEPIR|nr:hypothetical protein LEP1GSC150_4695 [Leptospira interrogans serovar Copenhageni str. LT2050]EMK06867.1 hypothetical protein LEP1GSC166_0345 [Leptospira kirschneri]EMN07939.1 hypothetical protein LEP1GSC053_3231 [Leptospira interrogans serovar Muenchen str. Brem 129]EMO02879.1 hypothetical protein LEP1GSC116_4612 [Leptospira interrogans serovar Icterohaemorrhagiae str. Verdun HP]
MASSYKRLQNVSGKNTGRELWRKSLNLPNSKKGRICKSKSKNQ